MKEQGKKGKLLPLDRFQRQRQTTDDFTDIDDSDDKELTKYWKDST